MHLLYEEGGDIKIATVQSTSGEGDAQSWQATSLTGKKIKLKAKEVWLRFEKPEAQLVMDEAHSLQHIWRIWLLLRGSACRQAAKRR